MLPRDAGTDRSGRKGRGCMYRIVQEVYLGAAAPIREPWYSEVEVDLSQQLACTEPLQLRKADAGQRVQASTGQSRAGLETASRSSSSSSSREQQRAGIKIDFQDPMEGRVKSGSGLCSCTVGVAAVGAEARRRRDKKVAWRKRREKDQRTNV